MRIGNIVALCLIGLVVCSLFVADIGVQAKKRRPTRRDPHVALRESEKEHMKQEHDMGNDDYDVHSFFFIHDVDKDGFLDEQELMHILGTEFGTEDIDNLDEETRKDFDEFLETVYKEVDVNGDKKISYEEYLGSERRAEEGVRNNPEPSDYFEPNEDTFKPLETEHANEEAPKVVPSKFQL
eukprot:Nk52_evm34s1129 gene=Nk52_evmTU34s1129